MHVFFLIIGTKKSCLLQQEHWIYRDTFLWRDINLPGFPLTALNPSPGKKDKNKTKTKKSVMVISTTQIYISFFKVLKNIKFSNHLFFFFMIF